jgi:hypothetical protein
MIRRGRKKYTYQISSDDCKVLADKRFYTRPSSVGLWISGRLSHVWHRIWRATRNEVRRNVIRQPWQLWRGDDYGDDDDSNNNNNNTTRTSNKLFAKNSCTWNIIHKYKGATIWNLKPDNWGPLMVQYKKIIVRKKNLRLWETVLSLLLGQIAPLFLGLPMD